MVAFEGKPKGPPPLNKKWPGGGVRFLKQDARPRRGGRALGCKHGSISSCKESIHGPGAPFARARGALARETEQKHVNSDRHRNWFVLFVFCSFVSALVYV